MLFERPSSLEDDQSGRKVRLSSGLESRVRKTSGRYSLGQYKNTGCPARKEWYLHVHETFVTYIATPQDSKQIHAFGSDATASRVARLATLTSHVDDFLISGEVGNPEWDTTVATFCATRHLCTVASRWNKFQTWLPVGHTYVEETIDSSTTKTTHRQGTCPSKSNTWCNPMEGWSNWATTPGPPEPFAECAASRRQGKSTRSTSWFVRHMLNDFSQRA